LNQTLETQEDIARTHANVGTTIDVEPHPDEPSFEGNTYTARDMVGRRFMRKGQELYCAYVERDPVHGPRAHFALNFTKNYKTNKGLKAEHEWGPGSTRWENTVSNLGDMGRTLDKVPPRRVVYCVGSGPALMRNWKQLERVKRERDATIIGCNELLQYLPPGLLDYYTAFDDHSPDKWWRNADCSETTAIFGSTIPPSFKQANWADILWYRIGYRSQLTKMLANKRPNVNIVNPLYGVGPSELEIAWYFKPEVVVLVGHSYAYDRVDKVIYEHINEPLLEDRWEGILRAINLYCTDDILGKPIVTDYHLMITAIMTLTCCQMLVDAGVHVINATEGGILRSNMVLPAYANRPFFPEPRVLSDVIGEMHG